MISVLYFIEGAIKIPTVSVSPEDFNTTAMAEFGNYIQKGTELSLLAISAAQFYFCKQIEENIWFLSVMEQIFILFFPQERTGKMAYISHLCNSVLWCSNGQS